MSRPNEKLIGTHLPRSTVDRRPVGWLVPALIVCFFFAAAIDSLAAEADTTNKSAPKGTAASTAPAVTTTQPSAAEIVNNELVKFASQSDAETLRQAAITILKTDSSEGDKALLALLQNTNNEAGWVPLPIAS